MKVFAVILASIVAYFAIGVFNAWWFERSWEWVGEVDGIPSNAPPRAASIVIWPAAAVLCALMAVVAFTKKNNVIDDIFESLDRAWEGMFG